MTKTPEEMDCITLKDILGMTIEEYLFKHSEEIAEEVLNNNPLLKELKDNEDDKRVRRRIRKHRNGWISVKDRLPEAYKLVLCCAVGKLDTTYGYIEEDKTWTCNDEPEDSLTKIDHISFITHWMPLPKPPTEE